ncbi:MAG: hypothetical protein AB7V16_07800 [Vulcanibacillus sp.]
MKNKKKVVNKIYLDTYMLQKDMRIRMPKEIVPNLEATPGETYFEIYYDPVTKEIMLVMKESRIGED